MNYIRRVPSAIHLKNIALKLQQTKKSLGGLIQILVCASIVLLLSCLGIITSFKLCPLSLRASTISPKISPDQTFRSSTFTTFENDSSTDLLLIPLQPTRTLVLYLFYERDQEYVDNLNYFLDVGVNRNDDSVHYIIVINGESSVKPPSYRNTFIVYRENTCFDLGTAGVIFKALGDDLVSSLYRYFIIINASVRGPFMQFHLAQKMYWTEVFTGYLSDEVKLVGLSANCPATRADIPHVQTMFIATDLKGLLLLRDAGNFQCTKNMDEALNIESTVSITMLQNGYNFKVMQTSYDGWDWRAQLLKANPCEGMIPGNPFFEVDNYEGTFLHPLELVFYKTSYHQGSDHIIRVYSKRQRRGRHVQRHWQSSIPASRLCQQGMPAHLPPSAWLKTAKEEPSQKVPQLPPGLRIAIVTSEDATSPTGQFVQVLAEGLVQQHNLSVKVVAGPALGKTHSMAFVMGVREALKLAGVAAGRTRMVLVVMDGEAEEFAKLEGSDLDFHISRFVFTSKQIYVNAYARLAEASKIRSFWLAQQPREVC
eukprot:jgi/Mesen1/6841/ME000351S05954